MFDNRFLSVIKKLAERLHDTLEPEKALVIPIEKLKRQEGKDFGMQDYID